MYIVYVSVYLSSFLVIEEIKKRERRELKSDRERERDGYTYICSVFFSLSSLILSSSVFSII